MATNGRVSATMIEWGNQTLAAKMQRNRKRLDMLRVALSAHAETHPVIAYALHPERRITREARR